MHDDDRDLLDPAEGDPPSPEFVEELWTRLDQAWTTRDIPERTDPSPTAIDLAVLDEKDQPMGKNRLAMIAAAAAVVIVIVGLVVITGDDGDDTDVGTSNPPPATEPSTEEASVDADADGEVATDETTATTTTAEPAVDGSFDVTYIEVDAGSAVAANEDFAWVVGDAEGQLSTIDLATNTVVSTAELPAGSKQAWYAFGSVWIGNDNGTVARFDPDASEVVATIDVGGQPTWLEGGDEAVWLGNGTGREAVRIDPAANAVVARVPVAEAAGATSTTAQGAWVRDLAGSVYRIDPATDTVVATTATPSGGLAMAAGPDALWASGGPSGILYRIDPATDSVVAEVDISAAVGAPVSLGGLHYTGDSVFVRYSKDCVEASCTEGIARIDPATDEVVASQELREGWGPSGMSRGPNTAWTYTGDAIARIDF
jgi:hypothetical protein